MLSFVPRIAVVLLLVVAGIQAPAAAEKRPFNAMGEGRWNSGSIYGSEEVTHLGLSSLLVQYYDPYRGTGDLIDGLFYPTGDSIFRSANGDVLTFRFDEQFYFFDPANGVIDATLTFTGGTGRFQAATGSADVILVIVPNHHQVLFLFDGSIDY